MGCVGPSSFDEDHMMGLRKYLTLPTPFFSKYIFVVTISFIFNPPLSHLLFELLMLWGNINY